MQFYLYIRELVNLFNTRLLLRHATPGEKKETFIITRILLKEIDDIYDILFLFSRENEINLARRNIFARCRKNSLW